MMLTLDDSFLTDVFKPFGIDVPLCWDRLGMTVKARSSSNYMYIYCTSHDKYLDDIQGWDTSVRDTSSRGLIVQETRRPRDESSKGLIVKCTYYCLKNEASDTFFRNTSARDTLLRHRHYYFI